MSQSNQRREQLQQIIGGIQSESIVDSFYLEDHSSVAVAQPTCLWEPITLKVVQYNSTLNFLPQKHP